MRSWRPCATSRAASASPPLMHAPPRSARRTSPTTRRSAATALPRSRRAAATKAPGTPVNVLTHCNAGWLATVDWGTALAPIYKAHLKGLAVHVWVDETRPRNQGASLTAWELSHQGVPHAVIADNTGGHLMQHGLVDLRHHRRRPRHRARRCLQQDRHLPQGAGGAGQRPAVLCRGAIGYHRLCAR